MSLTKTAICDFGWKAVDFALEATEGKTVSLADVRGSNGTLVMFICNHCPYVKAAIGRIVRDMGELSAKGIGAVAIMPNDTRTISTLPSFWSSRPRPHAAGRNRHPSLPGCRSCHYRPTPLPLRLSTASH